jgi:hypothetical protein
MSDAAPFLHRDLRMGVSRKWKGELRAYDIVLPKTEADAETRKRAALRSQVLTGVMRKVGYTSDGAA